ncbi:MAG: pinensin family lanthipeptide [Cyclobacteriaceae bacterium]
MKKKLNIKNLTLKSFVTDLNQKDIKGGGPYTAKKNCDPETYVPLCV